MEALLVYVADGEVGQFIGWQRGLCLHQPVGQLQARLDTAKKGNIGIALDQHGRKILHFDIAQQVGLIFDVDPQEAFVGMAHSELIELRAVVAANIAPGCAQAGYQQVVAAQPFLQLGKGVGVQGQDSHGAKGE